MSAISDCRRPDEVRVVPIWCRASPTVRPAGSKPSDAPRPRIDQRQTARAPLPIVQPVRDDRRHRPRAKRKLPSQRLPIRMDRVLDLLGRKTEQARQDPTRSPAQSPPPPRPRAHPAERPLDGAEVAKLGLDFDHEDQAGDRMPGEDENSAPRSVAADLHLPCDVPAGALKPPGDVDRAPRVDDVTLPCVPRNGARTSSRSVAPIADSNRSMVSIDTSERQPRSTELIHACDTPARAASVRCVQPRGVRTSLTACPSRAFAVSTAAFNTSPLT